MKKKILVMVSFIIISSSTNVFANSEINKFDFNKDLIIDRKDLDMLSGNYNKSPGIFGWNEKFDLNGDKITDIYDVVKVANHFGELIVEKPQIIDTNLIFDFGEGGPRPNKPEALVLHHAEASNASVGDIHRWHKFGNGWAGIGYHFYIRKDGSIYKGREENWRGAHAPAYNDKSLGICVEGAYQKEYMPEVQKKAVIKLGRYLAAKYNIHEVFKHGEVTATDCPGKNYPFMEIKKEILDFNA